MITAKFYFEDGSSRVMELPDTRDSWKLPLPSGRGFVHCPSTTFYRVGENDEGMTIYRPNGPGVVIWINAALTSTVIEDVNISIKEYLTETLSRYAKKNGMILESEITVRFDPQLSSLAELASQNQDRMITVKAYGIAIRAT